MKAVLISDIHFGKFSRTIELSFPGCPIDDENSGAVSLVDGLIDIIKSEKAKYILVAGDLTSVANPLEYYYFEKAMLQIASKANISIENVICVTGNHDIDRNISKISETLAKEDMGDECTKILEDQYQKIAACSSVINMRSLQIPQNGLAPFSGIIEREDLLLFAINTAWKCSPSQEYAHGMLTLTQLDWLEESLKKYDNDNRTKILLLHHHPIKYSYPSPSEDISLIQESSELLDIAGKYGVNLIMHGHRHHPRAQTTRQDNWRHPISFICAGSLSVNAKHRNNGEIPNTAHIVDFQNAPDAFLLKTYEYSASTGWHLLSHSRPEAPLDAEVWLGKIFDEDVLLAAVQECVDSIKSPVAIFQYSQLPECLHFIRYSELNKKFRNSVPDGFIINGLFPEDVSIISTEAIKNANS